MKEKLQKFRRMLGGGLVLLLCVVCFSTMQVANAAEFSGTCGENVTWEYDEETNTLYISGTGEMDDFSSDSRPWFKVMETVENVVIGEGVTNVGDYAFSYSKYIKEVKFPESLTKIGKFAFYKVGNMNKQIEIELPESLESIERGAFEQCGVTSVRLLGDGVSIGEEAFLGCSELALFEIAGNGTSIGMNAFRDCTGLKEVTIRGDVVSIGNYAFYECRNLEDISPLTVVSSIGDSAFFKCKKLSRLELSGGLTSIGVRAFLQSGLESVVLPDSVTSIENNAFTECTSLKEITWSKSLETIGGSVFSGCTSLEAITLPDSMKTIGATAFHGCTGLKTVEVPDGLTSIGSYAFEKCSNLTSIELPSGLTNINVGVFYGCNSLTSIELPFGLTSIGRRAFYGCTDLKTVTLTCNWRKDIESGDFYGAKNIETVNYIHSGNVEFIADDTTKSISLVCENCGEVGKVTLLDPDADTKIVYDGTVKTATYAGEIPGETPVLTYSGVNVTNGTAVKAGTYTVYMAVGGQKVSVQFEIEKNEWAPNAPDATMIVPYTYTTVRDIVLPADWNWQKSYIDLALAVGKETSATAVYNGADKGNYKNEAVAVKIIRSECIHEGGTATCIEKATCDVCGEQYGSFDFANHGENELCNQSAATCTENGYTGDTCCKDCGTVIATGETVPAKGHNYVSVVTKEPTAAETGVLTYTCVNCKAIYTEVIEKLPALTTGITAEVTYASHWGHGGQVEITLTNGGESLLNGWNIELDLNITGELMGTWGEGYVTSFKNGHVTIANQSWAKTFEAGAVKKVCFQFSGTLPEVVICEQNPDALVASVNHLSHWGNGGQIEILLENTGASFTGDWETDLTINFSGTMTGTWGDGFVASYANGHIVIKNQGWVSGFESGAVKRVYLQYKGSFPVEVSNVVVR